jgi:type IV pilus assembly protein PilY1
LEQDLEDAAGQVVAGAGSASAVATNSTRLGTDTVVYQALFNSKDWSGEIKAIPLTPEGGVSTQEAWRTGNDKFADHTSRNIVTFNGTNGVAFQWDNLTDAQKNALRGDDSEEIGQARLNWLRGQAVPGMRERATLLGDIVNSNPVYAGRNNHQFQELPESLGGRPSGSETDPYTTYLETVKNHRREVLYVNANDGMLHAFDALTGDELFAYVPSMAFDKLKNLTAVNYGAAANPHRYVVDGPIFVGDAYHNGQWKNILVGTLGAGGKGIFVLDVTDPDNFGPDKVLFEYAPNTVGNVVGQPLLAPTTDGWKVIFGNGYNSLEQKARLFLVDLDEPASTSTLIIPAGVNGSSTQPNGLAAPALMVTGDRVVTSAYAGDLWGAMWKFDFTSSNTSQWTTAYSQGQTLHPLFIAQDSTDKVQPITAAPTLGINAKMDNAVMVYFGTGSYLTNADNQAGDTIQSFYAIADTGSRITYTDRDDVLMEKSISHQEFAAGDDGLPDTSGRMIRRIKDDETTTWWNDKRGWYLDLAFPAGSVTGERVISKPLLLYDRLLFPTLMTSSDPCAFGGSGWLMELIAVGDRFVGHSILGEDGLALDYAVMGLSDIIRGGESAYIPTSDIRGEINVETGELPVGAVGRMSWRQLR